VSRHDPNSGRNFRPRDRKELWTWIYLYTGVKVATNPVCDGHCAPFDAIACWQLDRPGHALLEGSRGSGKSFLSSIDTHLDSRHLPRHGTRILGGSKAQAQQVHQGLKEAVLDGRGPSGGNDKDTIDHFGVQMTRYHNGSEVSILAASPLSVRGPHVPCLKMDEVDEIDPKIRDDAHGMVMDKGKGAERYKPKIVMTSTHHNLGGPMEELKAQAIASNEAHPGSYPLHRFCVWEVLQPCPEEVSGRYVGGHDAYENCPQCPLVKYCHEGRERHGGVPKAKRVSPFGHYTVGSLLDKVHGVSKRVLEADYFCLGPKADGIWFSEFDANLGANVREIEFNPNLPLRIAGDAGSSCHTGAAYYQAWLDPVTGRPCLGFLADYYAEGLHSQQNAERIQEAGREAGLSVDRVARVCLDPAAGVESGLGPAALGEYKRVFGDYRVGLAPRRGVVQGLDFVEMLVRLADGTRTLYVHPRCQHIIRAFSGYRRKKVRGQWTGTPEDPQHPFEEMIDLIRYGAWDAFPKGYPQPDQMQRAHASNLL
jgi:hypothetical protein